MRITVIIVSVLIFFGCTDLEDEKVSTLDQKISALNMEYPWLIIDDPYLSGMVLSDSSHAYDYFKDSLSISQLVDLSSHEYPIVRYFSFYALKKRKYANMKNLILSHLDDTTKIDVSSGCISQSYTIADLMLFQTLYLFKGDSKDSLRDLIFYEHTNLEAFSDIIRTCPGHEPYYDRILKINEDSPTLNSLLALASYQKEQDLDFLESNIRALEYDNNKFQVIEKYPHERFKSIINEYYIVEKKDTTRDYESSFFNAISSYKNDWSKRFLERLVTEHSKNYYRKRNLLQSIMVSTDKYEIPAYDRIRERCYRELGKDTFSINYFNYDLLHSYYWHID